MFLALELWALSQLRTLCRWGLCTVTLNLASNIALASVFSEWQGMKDWAPFYSFSFSTLSSCLPVFCFHVVSTFLQLHISNEFVSFLSSLDLMDFEPEQTNQKVQICSWCGNCLESVCEVNILICWRMGCLAQTAHQQPYSWHSVAPRCDVTALSQVWSSEMPHMEAKDKTVVSRVRLDLAKHFLQGCYEIRKIKSLTHWLAGVGCSWVPSIPQPPSQASSGY